MLVLWVVEVVSVGVPVVVGIINQSINHQSINQPINILFPKGINRLQDTVGPQNGR